MIYSIFLISSFIFPHFAIQLCSPSQFFDLQHCQICQPNCYCTSYNTCTSCISGYTFSNLLNSCIQCPRANAIYADCTQCCANNNGTITSCTNCDITFTPSVFLSSGRCIKHIGCFRIDSNGFCIQCSEGYYQKNHVCQQCHLSCSTCLDSDNCLTCANGYYNQEANGALCTLCVLGCSRCDNTGKCSNCLDQYYSFINQCLPCPNLCLTCIDGSTCATCIQGILVQSICVLCNDTIYGGSIGCLNCIASNSFVKCQQCDDLYYIDQFGNCQQCSSTITFALRCQDATTPIQCQNDSISNINQRYYLISLQCILNQYYCKQMNSANGDCRSCYQNYYLDLQNHCIACPFAGCTKSTATVQLNQCKCYTCLQGFYLTNSSCLLCLVSNCATCNSTGMNCTECMPGYYLASSTTCSLVTAKYCNTSIDISNCKTCIDGYYIGSDSHCYKCQLNCLVCESKFVCKICAINYYLYQNAKCIQYPNFCVSIDAVSMKCNACSNGYYLDNGVCRVCAIQYGTLSKCSGLCPLDFYINNIIVTMFQVNTSFIISLLLICLFFN